MQQPELSIVRQAFNVAHQTDSNNQHLISITEKAEDPIIKSYHAAGLMISSKFQINPFKIMKVFGEGKIILEDMVSENFGNPEVHYIRYTIQLNAPRFAGYYKNLESDRQLLREYLQANRGSDLYNHIGVFVLDTKDQLLDLF